MDHEPSPLPTSTSAAPQRFRALLRFSLRTLFIVFTVGCIWLGIVTKRARDQRATVERILELGGSVRFDYEFDQSGRPIKDAQPPGWRWLRQTIGDEYFRDVVWVKLNETAASDNDLRLIGKLRTTKNLGLNGTQVSDTGLAHIRHLRRLKTLELGETRITDAGMAHLRDMRQLEHLGLIGTGITDDGLRYIENMDQLHSLLLQDTDVGDLAVDSLTNLKQLRTVSLQSTRVTSEGVNSLLDNCHIQCLYIDRTRVDDAAVEELSSQKSLAELSIYETSITGQGMLRLREALPSCRIDGAVTDLSSMRFDKNPQLPTVWPRLVKRLAALNRERRLKLIDLSGSQIADRFLPDLYELDGVEVIDLRETQATDSGVKALRQALPNCDIVR